MNASPIVAGSWLGFPGLRFLWFMVTVFTAMGMSSSPAGPPGPGLKAPAPDAHALDLIKKAASQDEGDLQQVRDALTKREGLLRLNTEREYQQLKPQQLAVSPVVETLAKNRSGAALDLIGTLCTSKEFLAEEARIECLIGVFPKLRSVPETALPLLRKASGPESGSQEIAIRGLFAIGNAAAMEIFATQVLNKRNDPELVTGWMRDPLLRHRHDPAALRMCLDLLKNPKLDRGLKNSLVEALFDYRPKEWYIGDGPLPKPPSGKPAAASKEILRGIGAVIAGDPTISGENKALAAKRMP